MTAAPRPVVLDSSPVLRWVLQEWGWQAVHALLGSKQREFVLPASALTEVLYRAAEKGNTTRSATLHLTLGAHMRIEPITAEDGEFAAEMVRVSRANPQPHYDPTKPDRTLSLGDALVLGQAQRLNADVLTCDGLWKVLADLHLLPVPVIKL